MSKNWKYLVKKAMASFIFALFVTQTPLAGMTEAATVYDLREAAVPKGDFGMAEVDRVTAGMVKPNVLFMVDLNDNMLFSTKAAYPDVVLRSDYDVEKWNANHDSESNATRDSADWTATKNVFGFTRDDVIDMMKEMTFGAGTLPTVSQNSSLTENNMYGRDIDESNNFTGHKGSLAADMEFYKDDYYFPHISANNDIRRAFNGQSLAQTNFKGVLGQKRYPKKTDPAQAYPYALVFRDPKYWANGWDPADGNVTSADLVPNDSRIYKAKLVLTRLLNDSPLFDNIKFGLATTFQARSHGYKDPNYKVDSFGSNLYSTTAPGRVFTNGAASIRRSGVPYYYRDYKAQFFYGWKNEDFGPFPSDYAKAGDDQNRYKRHMRAHLRLPMADSSRTFGLTNLSQREIFRRWLDGVTDVTEANISPELYPTTPGAREHEYFASHRNPELTPAGSHQTAMAIYPDPSGPYNMSRKYYLDNNLYWYEAGLTSTFDTSWNYVGYSHIPDNDQLNVASFLKNSGEAVGSVLDFFSPPVLYNDFYKAAGTHYMPEVSFPIKDVCEDNWMILVTSGNEVDATGKYVYHIRDAIGNLYNHANPNNPKRQKVTMFAKDANGNRLFKETDLKNPIRTLVIGLITSPDKVAGDPVAYREVSRMRKNLELMAKAGDQDNPNAHAFLADDVPSLIAAFNGALTHIIESQEQPDQGPMLEAAGFEDQTDINDANLFSSSYRINYDDQWTGRLVRYKANIDGNGGIVLEKGWDLAQSLRLNRGTRHLKYWHGGNFVDLAEGSEDFMKLTGMTPDRMDPSNVGGSFGNVSPADALYRWFQGYDYSYELQQEFPRENMLSDFGQSGLVLVNDPASVDSLPGYKEWADGIRTGNKTQASCIYAQTNDGVMHVIDSLGGQEKSALLPPPVLVPSRLASLKTNADSSGHMRRWIDVKTDKADGAVRSNPVYLLDGALQKKYINMTGSGNPADWGTYLFGTMGRAGAGIFMYDVSTHDKPKVMWYKEHIGNGNLLAMTGNDDVPTPRSADAKEAPYLKLGFNSPKPAYGTIAAPAASNRKMVNFIALPGGVRDAADLAKNGTEGAALLMIDPSDGSLLRSFDGSSLQNSPHTGSTVEGPAAYMGMMTGRPTLVQSGMGDGKYHAGSLFATDHKGNIFKVSFEYEGAGGALAPLGPNEWTIETVGTLMASTEAARGASNYSIPFGVFPAFSGGSLWLAGGAADVPVKTRDGSGDSFIKNSAQYIFSFNPGVKQTKPQYRDLDWKSLDKNAGAGDANGQLSPDDVKNGKSGWYFPLDAASGYREYVSANPVVVGSTLFIATFIEDVFNIEDESMCYSRQVAGDSRIYAVDLTTGGGNTWMNNDRYITLENVKATGLTESKEGGSHNLIVTYDKLSAINNLDKLASEQSKVDHVESEGMDAVVIRLFSGGGAINIPKGDGVIMYWSEIQ